MNTNSEESLAIFSRIFTVSYTDTDKYGELTFPNLFHYLEEIAFLHADEIAQKYEAKSSFDFAVVWTKMKVELTKLPHWKDQIKISTWITPFDPSQKYAYRNFKFTKNGETIGHGYGSLLFFDLKQRKAIPIPKEVQGYPTHDEIPGGHQFNQITVTSSEKPTSSVVHYYDLDIYQHVNNSKYLEFGLSQIESNFINEHRLISAELHFLKELRMNDEVLIHATKKLPADSNSMIVQINQSIINKVKEKPSTLIQTAWIKR
ncbi:MAG: acyl-[acyl-carrier-protein] thioesterase [Promethearchaeota archaeon]